MARLLALILLLLYSALPVGATPMFHRFGAADGMSDNRVTFVMQLPDGRMAIRTLGNVNIWDGHRFRYVHDEAGVKPYQLAVGNGCWRLMLAEGDLLWSQQWKNLRCLDLRHLRYIENIDSMLRSMGARGRPDDIFVSADGHTWITSQGRLTELGGAYAIRLRRDSAVLREMDVVGDSAYLFYDDGQMHCHRLTDGRQLYQLTLLADYERVEDDGPMTRLTRQGDRLTIVYAYRDRSRVVAVSPHTRSFRQLKATTHPLHAVAFLPDGTLITPNRVGYWQDSLMHQSLHLDDGDSIHRQIVCHATTDREGNLWLASYFGGALMTPSAQLPFRSVPLNAPEITQVWKDSLSQRLNHRDLFWHDIECNCHLTDIRGRIWIGTTDGLILIDNGQRRTYYVEDGLSNNYIHAIVEDHSGRLWMTTSRGITVLDGDRFLRYDDSHGTLRGSYVNNAAMLLPDGDILAWGVNGYTRFSPDSVRQESRVLRPVFTDFMLAGQQVEIGSSLLPVAEPYTDTLRLAYHQNNISLRFSAMTFRAPQQTRWRYRMKADTLWHRAEADPDGTLLLSFVDMRPGTHSLHIQAYTGDEPQSASCRTLTILIAPPWWHTPLAHILYAITLIAIILVGVWLYVRSVRHRMTRQQKEQLLMQRISDLMAQVELFEKESDDTEQSQEATSPDVATPTEETSSPDAEFIRRAIALVEQHVGERDYSVERLASDLCMERTGLYKKLSTLVSTSPTFFIRNIRLQRAATLLRTTDLSIVEISERTGFSSPSYFSKCFRDEMGCLPSEYRSTC